MKGRRSGLQAARTRAPPLPAGHPRLIATVETGEEPSMPSVEPGEEAGRQKIIISTQGIILHPVNPLKACRGRSRGGGLDIWKKTSSLYWPVESINCLLEGGVTTKKSVFGFVD